MNLFTLLSASAALLLAIASFSLLNTTHYFSNFRTLSPFSSSEAAADLILTNATIYTSDPSLPFAKSMAIRDGKIIGIGNGSITQVFAGSGTKKLDASGKVVVPGFIDSHVHFLSGGLQISRLGLRDVNEKNELVRKVKEAAENKEHGSWVLGGGWNNDAWGGELPEASWIDDVSPHNPVWLSRMDGHMGLANSLALGIAGITKHSKDPDGGKILRNGAGGKRS